MSAKILNSLSEAEFVLIRSTKKSEMAKLDEDELIDLHSRIRRARNKHTTNYRRAGAAKVGQKKSRGSGKSANNRKADKAEVFEDALSRVSRQLAVIARHSAQELKEQRLALARNDAPSFSEGTGGAGIDTAAGRAHRDTTRKNPGRKKREASTLAKGARRQAKRDGR